MYKERRPCLDRAPASPISSVYNLDKLNSITMDAVLPPYMDQLMIVNLNQKISIQDEQQQSGMILYSYPHDMDQQEQLRQIGLVHTIAQLVETFKHSCGPNSDGIKVYSIESNVSISMQGASASYK